MLLCPSCGSAYRPGFKACPRDGAQLRPPEELDPRLGSQIGNYALIELLGKGGMGVVYRGEHIYLHRFVAIKVLHDRYAAQPDAVSRFLQEARAAAAIGHPNIVDVSDFGETADGCAYFIMELVDGRPLDEVVGEGPLGLLRSINILNQVGRALAAAHEKGIVHRDLKPENVMLQKRPGRRELVRTNPGGSSVEREVDYDSVKLLDFGVAKMAVEGQSLNSTEPGAIFGTPEYMAPEAALGRPVDLRVDIYALGVLFYEMLTGTVPFESASPADLLLAHVKQPVPPPRQKNPNAEITDAAEKLILWCLEKDPARRPQSVAEVLEALQGCYGAETYRRNVERGTRQPRKSGITSEIQQLFAAGDGGAVLDEIMSEPTEPILLSTPKSAPVAEPAAIAATAKVSDPARKRETLPGVAAPNKFAKKSPKI